MLGSIDAILISTGNMNQMIEFYKLLGVPLKEGDHGGGLHAEADMGGVHFALRPGPQQELRRGSLHLSFHVPNLEEYCRELESKGVTFSQPPRPQAFGGVIAELHDPDGNPIYLNRWQSEEEYAKNFGS